MNEPMLETIEASHPVHGQEAFGCPLAAASRQQISLAAADELFFPKHKSVITQYSTDESGITELHLYYGAKEISFDLPELFAFGENLAKQACFVAGSATSWGEGYEWPQVRELLEQLLEEGVLQRTEAMSSNPIFSRVKIYPSPLPPAASTVPRTWFESEEITRELTGYALELGYLELVIPIFRVAHIALDTEGHQVGEANVFPKPLRLDVPTEWRGCPHPGSRYQTERPMNVTALKSMRKHWPQIMAALLHIREAFLQRFPKARNGWTVGDLERLSSLVLAVPAYLLMRTRGRVENGDLHPALSSMFRVTDGLRMTMHQMLFLPSIEPTLAPDAPMTSAEIYAYAERNYVFFSEHGVCAGPKGMIEEFLSVLVDGKYALGSESVTFVPPLQAALDELDAAFDYGLSGLQAHAIVFSLWPAMGRTYERLWTTLEAWSASHSATLIALRERFRNNVEFLRTRSLLASEEWCASREQVYADMYAQCTNGLGSSCTEEVVLAARITPIAAAHHANVAQQLRTVLRQRCAVEEATHSSEVESLVASLMDYIQREQAIVRAACEVQQRINRMLGRAPPTRLFTASAIDLYNQMQGNVAKLPYLLDEIEEMLGLRIVVTADAIEISDRATQR